MKRYAALVLGILSVLDVGPAAAANSVTIESKTVTVEATGATVGVYFANDIPITGVVLPLEIRSVSSQSYIYGTLELISQGRLAEFEEDTGSYVTKRVYAAGAIPPISRAPYCPSDTNGNVWKNPAASVDFLSPDAVLYAIVGADSLLAGSDGPPDSGIASLVLQFGVNDMAGSFEVDTTCIYPGNHLLFVNMNLEPITPVFEKSTITVIEPSDTLSGHIVSDLNLRGNIYLSGDLTIESGVTVSVRRGAVFTASSLSDDQAGGADSGRVEVIVAGTILIDSLVGNRPAFGSDSGFAGAWYGVRVMPGGRFETGIGAVVENALIGVTVESEAVADTLSGLTIRDCGSIGLHLRSDAVAFVNDTVQRVWPGKGIYADSSNPMISGCFVDSCEYGIYTRRSSSRLTNNWVDGPGVYGIYVQSAPPLEETDTLRLVHDTVYGYFSQAQMNVGVIALCKIDSCGFISDLAGTRSPIGITTTLSNVRLRHSTIKDFTTTGFYSAVTASNLGLDKPEDGGFFDWGYNQITADTTGCGSCLLRRVQNTNPRATISADGNWWGSSSPLAAWFSGPVDWTPYLDEQPAGKVVVPEGEVAVASVPSEYSLVQNYPNPFNSSTEIEFALKASERVEIRVYSILGQVVKTLADRQYPEGTHRVVWDGTDNDSHQMASGIYLYRIVAGSYVESKKMVLLK